MRYTNTTEESLYEFVRQNKNLIDYVDLLKVSEQGFLNTWVGYQAELKFKIVTADGYRNKYVSLTVNSSYLDDDYPTFEDYGELVAESLNNDLM